MHPDVKAWLWRVVLASLLCTAYSATIKDKSKDSEEWDFEFEEHSRDEVSRTEGTSLLLRVIFCDHSPIIYLVAPCRSVIVSLR